MSMMCAMSPILHCHLHFLVKRQRHVEKDASLPIFLILKKSAKLYVGCGESAECDIFLFLKAKIQQEQLKVKLFSTQQIMAIVFPLS